MAVRLNPEFQRNLWLELTLHRLIAAPFVIAIAVLLAYVIGPDSEVAYRIAATSGGIVIILGYIYGPKLSASSVSEEIRERTWVLQRMSSLSAWSMAWGKLVGSTIFAWYGMLLASVVFLISATSQRSFLSACTLLAIYWGLAMLAQAGAMTVSLDLAQRSRLGNRPPVVVAVVPGLFLVGVAFGLTRLVNMNPDLEWYGLKFSASPFIIISLLVFILWSLLAVYRLLQIEFQYKTLSWAWFCFVLFLCFYLSGFVPNGGSDVISSRVTLSFFISTGAVYLMVILEPKDPVHFRKLIDYLSSGRFLQLIHSLPKWIVVLPVSIVFGVWLTQIGSLWTDPMTTGHQVQHMPIALILFVVRDIALLYFLHISGRTARRADGAFFVYLGILYILVPLIFRVLDVASALPVFYPAPARNLMIGIGAPLLEAGLMIFLVIRKWARSEMRASYLG